MAKKILHTFLLIESIEKIVRLFPTKEMQNPLPPPLQFCSYFYIRCAQSWIEWKISFPISSLRIVVGCIYNLRWHTGIFKCHQPKKKVIHMCSNLQKRCAMNWTECKINFSIFVIFWVMVDFSCGRCKYEHFWNFEKRICPWISPFGWRNFIFGDGLHPPHLFGPGMLLD